MADYNWLNDYIGIPYECNGRGPDAFDCYGLVLDVYKKQLGVTLPDWTVDDSLAKTAMRIMSGAVGEEIDAGRAVKVSLPRDFDIMVLIRHQMAHHVGICVAGGVLHTKKGGAGVLFEPLTNFESAGRGRIEVYRWRV